MPIKKYGIYLAYGPVDNFRREGLGRALGEFLHAGQTVENVRFVVVAPLWFKDAFQELQDAFGLDPARFDLITPKRAPVLWSLYNSLRRLRQWARKRRLQTSGSGLLEKIRVNTKRITRSATERVVGIRSPILAALSALIVIPVSILLIAAMGIFSVVRMIAARIVPRWLVNALSPNRIIDFFLRIGHRWTRRGREHFSGYIQENEARFLAKLANRQRDVQAWYAPAAFWPQFNLIKKPRLTCVPDVVLAEFPIPFASEVESGETRHRSLSKIEECIAGGDHFVTYSSYVKHHTLVNKFNIRPSKICVIPHGANRLDDYVTVTGFPNNEKAAHTMAVEYFGAALTKASREYPLEFNSGELRYIFYPSQIRPNKNIITLLRAYKYLRTYRRLPLKLILTGVSQTVNKFIVQNDLGDDILCLRDLTEKELAACYKLAQLAVNPSILEGGMPFTFTEAVSVGTPIIMSDIEVTREVITDPDVRMATLFDPYDWQALASKIEWALENKISLYTAQRKFFDDLLCMRTWENVVLEHIANLDQIAQRQSSVPAQC